MPEGFKSQERSGDWHQKGLSPTKWCLKVHKNSQWSFHTILKLIFFLIMMFCDILWMVVYGQEVHIIIIYHIIIIFNDISHLMTQFRQRVSCQSFSHKSLSRNWSWMSCGSCGKDRKPYKKHTLNILYALCKNETLLNDWKWICMLMFWRLKCFELEII